MYGDKLAKGTFLSMPAVPSQTMLHTPSLHTAVRMHINRSYTGARKLTSCHAPQQCSSVTHTTLLHSPAKDLLWKNYVSAENKRYGIRSARLSVANVTLKEPAPAQPRFGEPAGQHGPDSARGEEGGSVRGTPRLGGDGSPRGTPRQGSTSQPVLPPLRTQDMGPRGTPRRLGDPGYLSSRDASARNSARRRAGDGGGRAGGDKGRFLRGGGAGGVHADRKSRQQKLRLRVLEKQLQHERYEKERWRQNASLVQAGACGERRRTRERGRERGNVAVVLLCALCDYIRE